MTECGHTPDGKGWPVCSLPPHDADEVHESADFWWRDDETEPHVKGRP